jgi:hypothetical protein
VGRGLAGRRDARLAGLPRAHGGARLRRLGALDGRPPAARLGGRGHPDQLGPGSVLRGLLAGALGAHLRWIRLPHAAARLDQRRGPDRVLPRGGPRDQARVHRGPPLLPPRRSPSRGRSGAWPSRPRSTRC